MPNVLVIGASTGLGRATARAFLRADATVVAAGRDVDAIRAALAGPAPVAIGKVDLADLADVHRFARATAAGPPLDAIVCNAGVQVARGHARSADGHELTFAVNHLAHAAIALTLVPHLRPGARVVFIGSGTLDPRDRGARRFGFRGGQYTTARALADGAGDPAVDEAQHGRDRYATSKLCNLLMMAELARRVPAAQVGFHALDPGLMPGTNLARDRSWIERLLWRTVMRAAVPLIPGASTARRSGAAVAWLATDPALAGQTGRYVDYRRRVIEPWEGARRTDWAADLYAGTIALAGIDPAALPSMLRP
ncbi:MAG: SDR family NAD(P)-dependent oxidoreductase [Deltaproteobacteria bacterium]|nr:SDR family NAD(P)-dependent oxidoreductase [Deltaproteobacteria bacterium]